MLIPRTIFQSWKTKDLPPLIQENVQQIIDLNPGYYYELSDDNDCRDFLQLHFGQRYVDAFDALLPGAFKCDFWRYAKLYIEGGIYLDLDMHLVKPFDTFIHNNEELITVVDRKHWHPPCAIYQAFIATMPNHPIMKIALELTLKNIEDRKPIGETGILDITGPVVMGRAFNIYWHDKNTIDDIKPGVYNRIRLYYNREDNSTVDLEGRIVLRNKVDGYENVIVNYYSSKGVPIYHKSYRPKHKKYKRLLLLLLLIIIIMIVIFKIKLYI